MMMALILFSAFSCKQEDKIIVTDQKQINRIASFSDDFPKDYKLIDYSEKALNYDNLVYDFNKEGTYFPLIWDDHTYNTYGIAAYVGDPRHGVDGSQEAVTNIASVLSASLLGIDKSNQNGVNFVAMLNAFFSEDEQIVLNNPAGSSEHTSLWYLIYPAILFVEVSLLYSEEAILRANSLTTIESWYQAALVMLDSEFGFDYSHFNFSLMEPYRNNIWREPDSAVGISYLMYLGYKLTADDKYRQMAIDTLKFIENDFFGSPMYELLLFYGPYLAALYNEQFSTNFNVGKMFDKIFEGNSIPRGGWGMIVGKYGDYPMDGLIGSITDGGGYAFSMNGFVAANVISKTVHYAPNYARDIAKWLTHLISNSRYYFQDQTKEHNQSIYNTEYSNKALEFNEIANSNIPYEGIRKVHNARTPWFGGDPTTHGWAQTDISLYSGSHVGMLAALIEETDVEGILKFDLNKGDYLKAYQSYLIYNPHNKEKTITYNSGAKVDLYDKVGKKYLAKNTEEIQITLKAQQAMVIVELPTTATISKEETTYLIAGKVFDRDYANIIISNYKPNAKAKRSFTLEIDFFSTYENDEIISCDVLFEGKTYSDLTTNINLKATSSGGKLITVTAYFKSGLKDTYSMRLRIS
jgi:hypothetical protein